MLPLPPMPFAPTAPIAPRLLAVDNLVHGEYRNGKWQEVSPESPRAKTYGTATWYPVGPTSTKGATLQRGTKIETEGYFGVFLKDAENNPRGVYLSGVRPRQPRRIEALPNTNAAYRSVVRRWLDAKGMKRSPVRIVRLLRTDLDGDGTKEILIEARSADDLPQVGFERKENAIDYSLLLLRTVKAGKAVGQALAFSRADGPAGSSGQTRVRAVADLDGDGRMEIVTSWDAWEVHAAELWSFRRGVATSILQNGVAL